MGPLDWECAGWYPEYWKFAQFFRVLDRSLDWHKVGRALASACCDTSPIWMILRQRLHFNLDGVLHWAAESGHEVVVQLLTPLTPDS